jgi:hypothetical protein
MRRSEIYACLSLNMTWSSWRQRAADIEKKIFVMALKPVLDDEGSKFHCEGEDLYRRTIELMQVPGNLRAHNRDTESFVIPQNSVRFPWKIDYTECPKCAGTIVNSTFKREVSVPASLDLGGREGTCVVMNAGNNDHALLQLCPNCSTDLWDTLYS